MPGTVPRGWLREDKELFTGKKRRAPGKGRCHGAEGKHPESRRRQPQSPEPAVSRAAAAYPDDVDKFPFRITKEMLERGQGAAYQIFLYVSVTAGPVRGDRPDRATRFPQAASFLQT